MTTFHGGPADGVTLELRRSPLFLRVVVATNGSVDALDQLDDEPCDGEEIHVYRRVGKPGWIHILYGGSKRRQSGFRPVVEYRLCERQPDVAVRDAESWREWARQEQARLAGATG